MTDQQRYLKILKFLSDKGFTEYTDITNFFKNYQPNVGEHLYTDNAKARAMYRFLDQMANSHHLNFRPSPTLTDTHAEAVITHKGLEYLKANTKDYSPLIANIIASLSLIVAIIAVVYSVGKDREIENLNNRVEKLESKTAPSKK